MKMIRNKHETSILTKQEIPYLEITKEVVSIVDFFSLSHIFYNDMTIRGDMVILTILDNKGNLSDVQVADCGNLNKSLVSPDCSKCYHRCLKSPYPNPNVCAKCRIPQFCPDFLSATCIDGKSHVKTTYSDREDVPIFHYCKKCSSPLE
jgi:hypothetical protein